MTDSRVLPDIAAGLRTGQPAVRALAAELLARWGRPEGLPAAAEVASGLGLETRIRAQALGVFQSFKGPRLRRFLLDVLKASQPQPAQVRVVALRGLRWYDDDETLSWLGRGLSDSDSSVRKPHWMV
jgi:hypothetical protein